MNIKALALALTVPFLAVACGDSGGTAPPNNDLAMAPDMAGGGDMAISFPAAPTLGMQIDRVGRPGVNTALTDPFDTLNTGATPLTINQAKDAYNSEPDPTKWTAKFAPWIIGNLAIFDGLDTNCGNQVAADAANPRYSFLGGYLATDVLLVDTTQTSCAIYLGVEAHALLATPADCGGRTPTEDVIDETYSLLAAGAPSGVTDGVPSDGEGSASTTAFPFLGAPN